MVYGAIIGDIVGSRFEFDRGPWTKDFELFTDECEATDDTIMTVAVADALQRVEGSLSEEDIKEAAVTKMKQWGGAFPNAGYGMHFKQWLQEDDPWPYSSFGNGSAMRTSAVGWMYNSFEDVQKVAKWIAEISHNHPEGIKGAVCTAMVIYMARKGFEKDQIESYVRRNFDYNIDESLESMRARHEHNESCMDSLPKALVSFLRSDSFEDAIRNAVSLGGDADTIAAIAGSMAEAYYGVPEELKEKCLKKLPPFIAGVVFSLENVN